MEKRKIVIRDNKTGDVLASAVAGEGVRLFEGTWYFDADAVDMTHLKISQRTYTCPYKGVCYWIDLHTPEHEIKNVAFTYFDVNPGYEFIQDKIGFYAGIREATFQETKFIQRGAINGD